MIIFMTYITGCVLHGPLWGLQVKHLQSNWILSRYFKKAPIIKRQQQINLFANYLKLLQRWYFPFRRKQWRSLENLQSPRDVLTRSCVVPYIYHIRFLQKCKIPPKLNKNRLYKLKSTNFSVQGVRFEATGIWFCMLTQPCVDLRPTVQNIQQGINSLCIFWYLNLKMYIFTITI